MIDLTPDVKSEISSLQWLTVPQLKEQYGELLADGMKCERVELLRAVIAYRLQERFYGMRLRNDTRKVLQKAVAGDKLVKKAEDSAVPKKTLIRNWKGTDYKVILHGDSRVEYNGKMYRSLTAVAKAITGSHWNGPVFFGVKK